MKLTLQCLILNNSCIFQVTSVSKKGEKFTSFLRGVLEAFSLQLELASFSEVGNVSDYKVVPYYLLHLTKIELNFVKQRIHFSLKVNDLVVSRKDFTASTQPTIMFCFLFLFYLTGSTQNCEIYFSERQISLSSQKY